MSWATNLSTIHCNTNFHYSRTRELAKLRNQCRVRYRHTLYKCIQFIWIQLLKEFRLLRYILSISRAHPERESTTPERWQVLTGSIFNAKGLLWQYPVPCYFPVLTDWPQFLLIYLSNLFHSPYLHSPIQHVNSLGQFYFLVLSIYKQTKRARSLRQFQFIPRVVQKQDVYSHGVNSCSLRPVVVLHKINTFTVLNGGQKNGETFRLDSNREEGFGSKNGRIDRLHYQGRSAVGFITS